MKGVAGFAVASALFALLMLGLSACGDGGSDSSTAGPSAATERETTAPAGDAKGSAGFIVKGGDNSVQTFGEEAGSVELSAAEAALSGYLRARAKDDWDRECEYLAEATLAPLEATASRSPQFESEGCATVLSALLGDAPASSRANTMTAGVASLRVESHRAFALYHGAGGIDYFVPMTREDGEWKIGSVAPIEFP